MIFDVAEEWALLLIHLGDDRPVIMAAQAALHDIDSVTTVMAHHLPQCMTKWEGDKSVCHAKRIVSYLSTLPASRSRESQLFEKHWRIICKAREIVFKVMEFTSSESSWSSEVFHWFLDRMRAQFKIPLPAQSRCQLDLNCACCWCQICLSDYSCQNIVAGNAVGHPVVQFYSKLMPCKQQPIFHSQTVQNIFAKFTWSGRDHGQ